MKASTAGVIALIIGVFLFAQNGHKYATCHAGYIQQGCRASYDVRWVAIVLILAGLTLIVGSAVRNRRRR